LREAERTGCAWAALPLRFCKGCRKSQGAGQEGKRARKREDSAVAHRASLCLERVNNIFKIAFCLPYDRLFLSWWCPGTFPCAGALRVPGEIFYLIILIIILFNIYIYFSINRIIFKIKIDVVHPENLMSRTGKFDFLASST